MRIAVISDIHGNLYALEAVLKDLKMFAPDKIIVAGDMIGGGPKSREVLELLSTIDCESIRGTHEDLLLVVRKGQQWADHMWVEIAKYELENLGDFWIEYMEKLPDHRFFSFSGKNDVCAAHGVPGDTSRTIIEPARDDIVEQYIADRFLTLPEMKEFFEDLDVNLFITAHSHMQFYRQWGDIQVVNPGCVIGEYAICGDQLLAEYAILDLAQVQAGIKEWKIIFRQVSWNYEAMIADLEKLAGTYACFRQYLQYYRNLRSKLN